MRKRGKLSMRARKMMAAGLVFILAVMMTAGCTSQKTANVNPSGENNYGLDKFVMVMIPGEDSEKSVKLEDNLAADMTAALGIPCTVYRATDYSAAVEAMRTGNAQMAEYGPFSYVTARERAGAEAIAVRGTKDGVSGYTSQIVVRADSDIETLKDLQGKTFAFVDPESTSGNIIPTDEILTAMPELNLTFDDLHTDGKFFKSAMYAGTHPGAMQAVAQGNVDAAAVASTTLENQIAAGNIKAEDLKIIYESPVIPSDPIAIKKDLPQEFKDKVKAFLFSYDDAEFFNDEAGKEPERFIEIKDSDYDYLQSLKEKYKLND
ncbi:phosphate/phosphite/phosphonate ABC transporter substrate-binding protein [Congzhengia minquanensis]